MRLRVVGCSGMVPGPESSGSCYLVEADDAERTWRIVLDLGAGALGPLQRWCDPRILDAVAVTHLHPDHAADLAALHVYLSRHPDGPSLPVVVFGPSGTPSRLGQFRGSTQPSPVLDIRAWEAGGSVAIGPLAIRSEAAHHSVPAFALRVSGPREDREGEAVLAYSGDTDECPGLDEAARGADAFLCEASFPDAAGRPRGMHLTAAKAGAIAEHAGAGRLILTHIPPWADPALALAEAEAAFSGPVDLARPGLGIDL